MSLLCSGWETTNLEFYVFILRIHSKTNAPCLWHREAQNKRDFMNYIHITLEATWNFKVENFRILALRSLWEANKTVNSIFHNDRLIKIGAFHSSEEDWDRTVPRKYFNNFERSFKHNRITLNKNCHWAEENLLISKCCISGAQPELKLKIYDSIILPQLSHFNTFAGKPTLGILSDKLFQLSILCLFVESICVRFVMFELRMNMNLI